MKFGFSLPNTLDPQDIRRFASTAEDLGFHSIWSADHIVLPTEGTDQYPYSEDGSFSRPSSVPFLELMTVLSYVAACTSRIHIGSTVMILPYRNPVLQAKMFASLDVLSGGRAICGVGVGWLEKEFDTLNSPYSERGSVSDEYLTIFKSLWTEDDPKFHGQHYDFDGIKFYPKPIQKPHIPIWIGGHSKRAIRRAAVYGNAWHPTRQTPIYVSDSLPYLRECAEYEGRNPDEITVSLKRTLHFTDLGIVEDGSVPTGGAVVGNAAEVVSDIRYCQELGIQQLTYDFLTSDVDQCVRILEHFAEKVAPVV